MLVGPPGMARTRGSAVGLAGEGMSCILCRMRRLLVLFALGVPTLAPAAASPPNVLMIAVDDLNDFSGFMQSYPDARTPNMDRLAERGMVLSRAHSQYPLCGPSRASLMAGLLPPTLNFPTHMRDEALAARAGDLDTELLHGYFARHGYRTLAVGKICHTHVPKGSVDESGGRGGFTEGTGKLKRNWHQEGTSTDWAMAPGRDELLPDHQAAAWAVRQLEVDHDQPFLLMVGFLRPHVPWYVPAPWFEPYDKENLTLPPFHPEDLTDVPARAKEISILPQMPRTEWAIEHRQWRNILQAYLACISFADHQVGKVLDALDQSPYRDNTLVVLWSDHGYHLGEKNTFQKQSLWERSSHVPLVFAGPGIVGGGRCDRIVSLLDIYPTLLDLCGLPANPRNEGRSLVPLLRDPSRDWPFPAITYWQGNNVAIQDERYRYIRYDDGSEELYDHQRDPHEWTNLAGAPASAPVKERLAGLIPAARFTTAAGSSEPRAGSGSRGATPAGPAKREDLAPDITKREVRGLLD